MRLCPVSSSVYTDVPLNEFVVNPAEYLPKDSKTEIYLVCRFGNDSQVAADALRSVDKHQRTIKDVVGGLRAWSKHVDINFPVY
jgi:adenylyltransferase/sulfurtransferase